MEKRYSRIRINPQDDICWVTIDRPGDRNSIDTGLMRELDQILREAEKTETRAVVFTGAGKTYFIGGADGVEMTIEKQADEQSIGE